MAPDLTELQTIVRTSPRVSVRGAGSKSTVPMPGATALEIARLSGITEYQPSEFIVTAWAGTPIAEVSRLLAERGQYLPFDPLLAERGATVGGTIAANANGPERYRYGGVRDFIIGARFIDGNGELIRGGGKVVKNAAGFDYPKLMVGSLGQLGALVDATFKVFPRPEAYATLQIDCPSLAAAVALLPRLTNSPYDINAIDLVPGPRAEPSRLHIRIGGLRGGLAQRLDRARALAGGGEVIADDAEEAIWSAARELTWASVGECVVKAPLTPGRIASLDAGLGDAKRRYSVGGNVAWIAIGADRVDDLDAQLRRLGLAGLILTNAAGDPRIGATSTNEFARRVKRALDPRGCFAPFP